MARPAAWTAAHERPKRGWHGGEPTGTGWGAGQVCRALPFAAKREDRQRQRGTREKPVPEHQTVYFRPLPFAFAVALGASSTMGSASTAASAMAASGLTDLRTS